MQSLKPCSSQITERLWDNFYYLLYICFFSISWKLININIWQVGLMRGGRLLDEDRPSKLMEQYSMTVGFSFQSLNFKVAFIM